MCFVHVIPIFYSYITFKVHYIAIHNQIYPTIYIHIYACIHTYSTYQFQKNFIKYFYILIMMRY